MNQLPFKPLDQLTKDDLIPGLWVSLSDTGTTVQRLAVIVERDSIVEQLLPEGLRVVHYIGLQQPTNIEEDLYQYHSRTIDLELDGSEWGGSMSHTLQGVLTDQPAPIAPVEDVPGPEALSSPFAEAIYSQLPPPSRKTSTYETFLAKHGQDSRVQSFGQDYGVGRMKGKPLNFADNTPAVPGFLKQVVVMDEQGVRVIPYAMVPEGYVRVDLYSVFSKVTDNAPVVEDVPDTTQKEYEAMKHLIQGKIADQMKGKDTTRPVLSIQANPFIGMDSATGPDQTAYLIAKVEKDGTVTYSEAPENLHGIIEYKLTIPSTDGTSPDAPVE